MNIEKEINKLIPHILKEVRDHISDVNTWKPKVRTKLNIKTGAIEDNYGRYYEEIGRYILKDVITKNIPGVVIHKFSSYYYPDFHFSYDGKNYAIDIKSARMENKPAFDLFYLSTYEIENIKEYEQEWVLIFRYDRKISAKDSFVECYMDQMHLFANINTNGGVSFGGNKIKARPLSWKDIENKNYKVKSKEELLKLVKNSCLELSKDTSKRDIINGQISEYKNYINKKNNINQKNKYKMRTNQTPKNKFMNNKNGLIYNLFLYIYFRIESYLMRKFIPNIDVSRDQEIQSLKKELESKEIKIKQLELEIPKNYTVNKIKKKSNHVGYKMPLTLETITDRILEKSVRYSEEEFKEALKVLSDPLFDKNKYLNLPTGRGLKGEKLTIDYLIKHIVKHYKVSDYKDLADRLSSQIDKRLSYKSSENTEVRELTDEEFYS